MSSQDSMFLPSLAGRAAPWDTSRAHNWHWGQSHQCHQAISLPFPRVTTDVTVCYKPVCVLAAQAAAAHLPGQFPASHILAYDDLRLCNHLMGCWAAVSFPKVSSNISAGSFKFYAEISKWPTKMTSFVFREVFCSHSCIWTVLRNSLCTQGMAFLQTFCNKMSFCTPG